MIFQTKLPTRKLSFIAVMTALCVTTNYLMLSLANIKFMDLFVFVSGYVMGSLSGVLVGCLTWLVYGTINPYGFSLPILVATIIGESLYGLVGGLFTKSGLTVPNNLAKAINKREFWTYNAKFAFIGFLLTFIYDLFTNIISGLTVGIPISVAIISGVPFAIAHEVSNLLFFFFGATVLINTLKIFTIQGR